MKKHWWQKMHELRHTRHPLYSINTFELMGCTKKQAHKLRKELQRMDKESRRLWKQIKRHEKNMPLEWMLNIW